MVEIVWPYGVQIKDNNGDPAAGAKLTAFDAGTTTPKSIYADTALTVFHPVPLVADASGYFPPIYIGSGTIKINITDANDVALTGPSLDPAPTGAADTSSASAVGFDATADIPQTNVQDAIEQVQTNLGSLDASGITFGADSIIGTAVTEATDSQRGSVELATTNEARTGTSASVVTTPATVVNVLEGQPLAWQFEETLFDFSTDGVQETIETSDLEDFKEYSIQVRNLQHNSGSSQVLNVTLIRASDDAGNTAQIADSITSAQNWGGYVDFRSLRDTVQRKVAISWVTSSAVLNVAFAANEAGSVQMQPYLARWGSADQTKIRRIRLSTTSGVNFSGGRIGLYSRLVGS